MRAAAHSSGLDASGCHGGSKPYYCHRPASDMVTTQVGQNRLRFIARNMGTIEECHATRHDR